MLLYGAHMEELDARILRLLEQEGRRSYTDLGKETGLSTSAVHHRVRRLEERGAIIGYRAVVDHDAMGRGLTALMSITPVDPGAPDDIPDRLRGIPQIESCFSVAGDENYILLVRVPGPGALEELLATIRSAANVTTRTTVVLSTPWEGRPVG